MYSPIPSNTTTRIDVAHLINGTRQALHATIFTSTLRVSPRRVNQIAQEVAATFEQFLKEEDSVVVRLHGQRLAQEGFSHQTVLALVHALHQACWASDDPAVKLIPVSGQYMTPLLEGYMAAREAHLLQEQERTRQALDRARLGNQ